MTDDDVIIRHLTAVVVAALDGDLPAARADAEGIVVLLGVGVNEFDAALRVALRFDPVGLAEVAEMTGESKQLLDYLLRGPGAPRPVHLARMKVWRRSEIVVWWASLGRELSWTG
jgi:predicted DNA-binding transcriptional regulator AlpA